MGEWRQSILQRGSSMKNFISTLILLGSLSAVANNDYLKPEDQPYYQNDSNGRNNLDRIDSSVKEINRLWGEINTMKNEIRLLKEQMAALKADAASSKKTP